MQQLGLMSERERGLPERHLLQRARRCRQRSPALLQRSHQPGTDLVRVRDPRDGLDVEAR